MSEFQYDPNNDPDNERKFRLWQELEEKRPCKSCIELPDDGTCDKCGDSLLTTKDAWKPNDKGREAARPEVVGSGVKQLEGSVVNQEINAKCESCGGTGLYVGMAERDGAAVVCSDCKGTGCGKIYYEPFVCMTEREGVLRVFSSNPGICIGGPNLEQFGGITKEEWYASRTFTIGTEDRAHTCPRWFYQCSRYGKAPEWEECYACIGIRFAQCESFDSKHKCWERFDKENGGVS